MPKKRKRKTLWVARDKEPGHALGDVAVFRRKPNFAYGTWAASGGAIAQGRSGVIPWSLLGLKPGKCRRIILEE